MTDDLRTVRPNPTVCPSARVPVLDLVADLTDVGYPPEDIATAERIREAIGEHWGHYIDTKELIPFICVRGRHFQLSYAAEALDAWAHPSPYLTAYDGAGQLPPGYRLR